MKKFLSIAVLLLAGCSPVKLHQVSPSLREGLREPFNLEVSSSPDYLKEKLSDELRAGFSKTASIIPSDEGGTIRAVFSSNPSLSTESDGQTALKTTPGASPRKRHIFQSAELELTVLDAKKEILWKVRYKYEGRNDFKASYIQAPEEALEECVKRVLDILERDMSAPGGEGR